MCDNILMNNSTDPAAVPAAPSVLSGKKIAVVEDDLMLASIMVRHFKDAGAITVLVTNGGEALGVLKREKPELIILDIFLPGQNGLDILEGIRKDDEIKDTRVMIVSNTDQAADRDRATNLGADFFLKATITPLSIVEYAKKRFV